MITTNEALFKTALVFTMRLSALSVFLAGGPNSGCCGEIHEAVKRANLEKVKSLVVGQPELVSSKDEGGMAPLHYAAQKGRADIAEFLLAGGACVNEKSKRGETPLHWAAANGHQNVVRLLLDKKAEVDSRDTAGCTPLHLASACGSLGIATVLLGHKADVNARSADG